MIFFCTVTKIPRGPISRSPTPTPSQQKHGSDFAVFHPPDELIAGRGESAVSRTSFCRHFLPAGGARTAPIPARFESWAGTRTEFIIFINPGLVLLNEANVWLNRAYLRAPIIKIGPVVRHFCRFRNAK